MQRAHISLCLGSVKVFLSNHSHETDITLCFAGLEQQCGIISRYFHLGCIIHSNPEK